MQAAEPNTTTPRRLPRHALWIALALAFASVVVHLDVLRHDFVNYDDNRLIYDEPHVQAGWTTDSVRWALTSGDLANWMPLARLSWLAEAELFGLRPGPMLAINLLWHALATLLLFVALLRLCGELWRSALVAAVFAVHPLHVESVAWAAERRDLMCGAFWMATLIAYADWVRRKGALRYAGVCACVALALLAKPMAVTLPCVLLLLDVWPLGRVPTQSLGPALRALGRCSAEKLPLFLLSAGASALAVILQRASGAMPGLEIFPLWVRIANSALAYVAYVKGFVWPVDLVVFHPHDGVAISLASAGVAAAGLALTTAFALRTLRHHPYFGVGWLWFVGTLVPVIGLIQVGSQAYADRYMYLPLVGLALIAVFGAAELADRLSVGRTVRVGLASLVLLALALQSVRQVRHWQDTETLFAHALALTENNWAAHMNLGASALERGQLERAAAHYAETVRLAPDLARAHAGYAEVLAKQGKPDAAIAALRRAAAVDPNLENLHARLASLVAERGRPADAIPLYLDALRRQPDSAELRARLGDQYNREKRFAEAIPHLEQAVRLRPDLPGVQGALGVALLAQGRLAEAEEALRQAIAREPAQAALHVARADAAARLGRTRDAIASYREALRLHGAWPEIENNLAWILASDPDPALRAPAEAVALAERAVAATGRAQPSFLDTLSVAYAAAGRPRDALLAAREAATKARDAGDAATASAAEARVREYEGASPAATLHDPSRRRP